MKFADLGLSDKLLQAVEAAGYTEPTPIQAQAIPPVLMMKDIIGIAQTGTGKTASFVLPMIDILASGRRRALMPRSLILAPTRELAAQVAENFEKYGKQHDLQLALLIGGVQMGDQVKALNEGVDVLIATPGRLMDLFERGKILLNGCELLVIDEADRMLDMGFIPDIETICSKLPEPRQTLLFSATMPREKRETLRWLLANDHVETAIIFANRKTTVREINKSLQSHGFASGEIHGDMDQSSRIAELNRFKAGEVNILVASDVAARGLDIKGVSHVFNFDTPWHPDDYVHRIGRTGRAGAKGRAFTFVTDDDAEAIANVEKLTESKIKPFGKEDVRVELVEAEPKRESDRKRSDERKADAPERDDDRESRKAKPARERKPRRDESQRDEARPGRSAENRSPRSNGGRGRREDNEVIPAGEWNGPKPDFLSVSAT